MFGWKKRKAEKGTPEAAKQGTPPPARKPTPYPQPPYGKWAVEVQAMIDAGVPAEYIDIARLEFHRGTKEYDGFVAAAFAKIGIDIGEDLKTYKGSN